MARRPPLALVSAQALRPALRLPSARALVAVAAAAGFLGLLYLVARETPLFALRTVEVTGAPPAVRDAVRRAAAAWEGESLVALDGDELQRRLEALPTVRSLRYDRAFPNTLEIAVVPERPAAVLRRGRKAWLVSERGRIMEALDPGRRKRLPRIRVAARDLRAGTFLADEHARLAVTAATHLPGGFPVRVRTIRASEDGVTLVLATDTEVRLGSASALPLKIAVAARVLRSLPEGERLGLAYLDVTVPERPVAANPQL
ncbi:MAG: cell division protein FtsQ/DivIB [Gaiellaceae bacterium]